MKKSSLLILILAIQFVVHQNLSAQGTFAIAENGVTITCEGASPGDTAMVNERLYTAVDE